MQEDSDEDFYTNSMEDDDDDEVITVSSYHKQESDTFEEGGDIGLGNDPIRLETFSVEDHSDL